MEFSCFLYDSMDVGNLISASSTFSKSSLNTWKFSVHTLLKPSSENFEHLLALEMSIILCGSLNILWHCLSLGLEWKLTFSSPVATAECSIFAGIMSVAFTASSFRIWNSSTGIPSPPLTFFLVMLPKAHLTSHSSFHSNPKERQCQKMFNTHTQKSLSRVQLFATPWIVAHQAPRSMGFSRHEYWSGLPFPSPKNVQTTAQLHSSHMLAE